MPILGIDEIRIFLEVVFEMFMNLTSLILLAYIIACIHCTE